MLSASVHYRWLPDCPLFWTVVMMNYRGGGDSEPVHVDQVQLLTCILGFSDIVSCDTDRRLPEGGAWGLRKRILRTVAFRFHCVFFLLNYFT